MDNFCLRCAEHLAPLWNYCPRCGTRTPHETPVPLEEIEPQPRAFVSDFSWGIVTVPLLMLVGTMLCMNRIGAFVGVPLIVAGVMDPLLKSLRRRKKMEGKAAEKCEPLSDSSEI